LTDPPNPTPDAPWARVDQLFSGEPLPPPVDVVPRVQHLRLLIGVALFLDIVGLLVTVVPGAVVTLWAWLMADSEAARIQAGGYDETAAASVIGIRNVARWAMAFCAVCLLAQAWLLHKGVYNVIWAALVDQITGLWGRLA